MAGTITVSNGVRPILHSVASTVVMVEINAVADASDGSYPTAVIENAGGMLTAFEFIPGATAPTTNMDITLLNEDSHDVLGGNGANIDTTISTKRPPMDTDGNSFPAEIYGDLTLTPTNNSVNSATFKIKLYFIP